MYTAWKTLHLWEQMWRWLIDSSNDLYLRNLSISGFICSYILTVFGFMLQSTWSVHKSTLFIFKNQRCHCFKLCNMEKRDELCKSLGLVWTLVKFYSAQGGRWAPGGRQTHSSDNEEPFLPCDSGQHGCHMWCRFHWLSFFQPKLIRKIWNASPRRSPY